MDELGRSALFAHGAITQQGRGGIQRPSNSTFNFFIVFVWHAYHFVLNICLSYLWAIAAPRLFVLGRVVGRVRPGWDSPPCQRSLCLPRAKPSNGVGGPAHNGSFFGSSQHSLKDTSYCQSKPKPSNQAQQSSPAIKEAGR